MDKSDAIAALAKAPLLFDPGHRLGVRLLHRRAGLRRRGRDRHAARRIPAQRLWSPLGMSDTSFALPAAKRARYALALAKDPLSGDQSAIHHATEKTQRWHSGGGGTVSTAATTCASARCCARAAGSARRTSWAGDGRADDLGPPAGSFVSKIADAMDPAATATASAWALPCAGRTASPPWPAAPATTTGRRVRHLLLVDPQRAAVVVFLAPAPGLIRLRYRQMLRNMVYQALTSSGAVTGIHVPAPAPLRTFLAPRSDLLAAETQQRRSSARRG
jgi:CubicO group peptidase (beta-lactamase class C family)